MPVLPVSREARRFPTPALPPTDDDWLFGMVMGVGLAHSGRVTQCCPGDSDVPQAPRAQVTVRSPRPRSRLYGTWPTPTPEPFNSRFMMACPYCPDFELEPNGFYASPMVSSAPGGRSGFFVSPTARQAMHTCAQRTKGAGL